MAKMAKPAASKKKISRSPTMISPSKAEQTKWQAEDDVRTLQRAGEIERDRARLARAQATAKKQAQDLARITGRKK